MLGPHRSSPTTATGQTEVEANVVIGRNCMSFEGCWLEDQVASSLENREGEKWMCSEDDERFRRVAVLIY